MKKRFTALFLALALCLGLAVPAFAADDTAAQAIAAYQQVINSPPSYSDLWYSKSCGYFYLDFDQNSIPELVMLYRFDYALDDTEKALDIYCYKNGKVENIDAFNEVLADRTKVCIVRFSDGTYGVKRFNYGPFAENVGDYTYLQRFSPNGMVDVNENEPHVDVYDLMDDPMPTPNKSYTPPTTPTQPAGNGLVIPNGTTTIDRNAYIDRKDVTQAPSRPVSRPSATGRLKARA